MRLRIIKVKTVKFSVLLLIISILLTSYGTLSASAAVVSDAPEILADGAVLLNLNNGEIVYEKNAKDKMYPASVAKLMTAIVVFDSVENLNSVVTVGQGVITKNIGNNISISEGEVFTVAELLGALLVGGANDAANVLATYVGGSIEGFAVMMNEKATELGAESTNFTNPSGIHERDMYTTAYDVAMIAKYACLNSKLVETASMESFTISKTNMSKERVIYNKNLMASPASTYYYKNAKGLSAGSTQQAGYVSVSMATEKTIPLLCVVLSSEKSSDGVIHSYKDASSLYGWAFGSYEYKTVLKSWNISYEMPVRLSAQADYVLLYPESDIELLLPVGIDVSKDIKKVYNLYSESVDAPIAKDTVVGEISLIYNGEILATSKLLTTTSVERSNTLYYIDLIDQIIGTTWFKVSLASFIVIGMTYLCLSVFRKSKRNKKKNKNLLN